MSAETVILPKNRVIEFRIRTAIPEAASEEEILEWLRSELSGRPLSPSNPLVGTAVRAAGEPTFEDTGLYLHNSVREVDGKLSVRT